VSSATVTVRVLPARALALDTGDGSSVLHLAGDELELTPDDAKQFVEQGFVERT